jgi:hypothetical protein
VVATRAGYGMPAFGTGACWYAGWWGPASTVAVLDTYPSEKQPRLGLLAVQPVYGAYGKVL